MTDTAGLFRDLEWGDSSTASRAYTSLMNYEVSRTSGTRWKAVIINGMGQYLGAVLDNCTFNTEDAAKSACQSDHETRILSTLNLDAFKARIRAEALEEVEPLLARVDRLIKNHHRLQCILDSMQYPEPDIDEDTLHSTPFQRDTMSAIFALMHLREYLKPYKDDADKDAKP